MHATERSRWNRILGVAGTLLILALPAADAVVVLADPELEPSQDYVSQGARSDLYGMLIVAGLAAAGVSLMFLAVLEWRLISRGWLRGVTVLLTGFAGFATFASAVVPADAGGGVDTLVGAVHIGFAATAITCAAAAPMAAGLATRGAVTKLTALLVTFTILGCALVLGAIRYSDMGVLEGTRGIWERVALGMILVWACVRFLRGFNARVNEAVDAVAQ